MIFALLLVNGRSGCAVRAGGAAGVGLAVAELELVDVDVDVDVELAVLELAVLESGLAPLAVAMVGDVAFLRGAAGF